MFTMSATWRGAILGGPQQVGQCRVRTVQQAEHVELNHLLPLRQWRADRLAEQHHTGVVDERVQTAQLRDRAPNDIGRLLLVSDVGLQHQRGTALVADACGERLQSVPASRRQRHGRAVICERGGRGRADAARSPRH
jgi:hypothetical protein